ncbi:MAG: hypothetical protein WD042_15195 [Phycisphaeraceae bacterium]
MAEHDSILAIAAYHEPLAFYRRRGGWYADSEEHHARFYQQDTVEKLAALGVTTVVWPGYKGLGLAIERAEMQSLKPFKKLLDRAGLELGVYLQCGSYYAETFYEENPQAHEWTALDYWGKPQPYSEFYRCYWRHRPCLTHRAFTDYVAHAAVMLIKEYGAIYFNCDNLAQMPCYTPHFQQAFRQFLREKYQTQTRDGLAAFIRRYGHPNVDNIVLPSGSARRPLESLHALPDPGLQDWVEFRCRLVAQHVESITAAARAANPAVRLSYNLSYDYGEFHQLVWATEPEWVAPYADFIFSEDRNQPRITADGRLISQVHTAKHVRAMGRRANLYPPHVTGDQPGHDSLKLWMMEMAVHNQACFGYLYNNDFDLAADDPRPAMLRFVHRHEKLFTDNTTVAQMAVLRSRHSSTINWLQATEGRLLAQQSLYQAGVQWDNIIETTLGELWRYRLLVLPETISLPDSCVKQIAEYVRQGGRVLGVGGAMSCDEWGRRRSRMAAMSLFGERDSGYGSTGTTGYEAAIMAAWLGLDEQYAGQLAAFPRLLHPRPCEWNSDQAQAPVLNCDHHALPLNHAQFIAAVREALSQPPLVEVESGAASPLVIPTLLRSNRTQQVSLHVLNYQPGQRTESTTWRMHVPELRQTHAALLVEIGAQDQQSLPITGTPDGLTVTLPPFAQYAGVVFEK